MAVKCRTYAVMDALGSSKVVVQLEPRYSVEGQFVELSGSTAISIFGEHCNLEFAVRFLPERDLWVTFDSPCLGNDIWWRRSRAIQWEPTGQA